MRKDYAKRVLVHVREKMQEHDYVYMLVLASVLNDR